MMVGPTYVQIDGRKDRPAFCPRQKKRVIDIINDEDPETYGVVEAE